MINHELDVMIPVNHPPRKPAAARDAAARARYRHRAARPDSAITRPFRPTPITLPTTAQPATDASHEAFASPRSSKKCSLPHVVTPMTRCASTRRPWRHSNTSPRTTSAVARLATVIASPWRMVGYMLMPSARNRTVVPFAKASSITAPKIPECRTKAVYIRSVTAPGGGTVAVRIPPHAMWLRHSCRRPALRSCRRPWMSLRSWRRLRPRGFSASCTPGSRRRALLESCRRRLRRDCARGRTGRSRSSWLSVSNFGASSRRPAAEGSTSS